ncbi:hypothetical protein PTTG_01788 [Puccinia triticina 1-1 BBBD Race 1]|uniref:Uncharacterized protein n=2 Tax=Puccinia triticina TaxID=208348 RepID=A0A0C4ELZ9_PUCT1|nr:uncharacterized protein PtA15_11A630 [Puccinia triticina]OAV98582.1 hypothetical protein PTTG_01788 [Puccinia triticina 1-1 BBBD Race 1]WAQ89938.1 hypothetical protein PtA15_11A630 [Puccinia triticina]WAR59982.1 hypothetical protein PtB15_11B623 [Puccinia triticina]
MFANHRSLGRLALRTPAAVATAHGARRAIHAGRVAYLPTGQHVAADGEELKAEHDKHMKSGNKDWNEKLATHSEAGIRAEKDTRSAAALQKDTVKDSSHGRN